jgi:hypothetical protein
VCPESWWKAAGKPVTSKLMNLCPDCHMGIHVAIDCILRGRNTGMLRPRWVSMAQEAFRIAKDNGLTPAQTL